MNEMYFLLLLLPSIVCYVEAQSPSDQDNLPPAPGGINNFQPSLAVVAGIMVLMFSLTFILIMYAKCCYRDGLANGHDQQNDVFRTGLRSSSGIDKTVVESLPFFKFSALRGSREGLECAVCLSKFEDIEVLRLLPKCKHAFHIGCIDLWLEKHSSCPLCRNKISKDDIAMVPYSNSLRFLDVREESNLELFVQREESRRKSSRFIIGNSFRKFEKGPKKEGNLPIREDCDGVKANDILHKFNHQIVMSDIMLKRRWSSLTSSDLACLNLEMFADVSSNRFSSLDSNKQESLTTQDSGKLNQNDLLPSTSGANTSDLERVLSQNEKRSMSEITVHSRFKEFNFTNSGDSSVPKNAAKEERLKRLWLPIARRTVQWYADTDRNSLLPSNTRQSLNV